MIRSSHAYILTAKLGLRACIHTRAFTRVPTHACIHTRAYTRVHTHACIHTRAYTRVHTHAYIHTRAYTHACMHACIYTHACMNACIRTRAYPCKHTCAYTHACIDPLGLRATRVHYARVRRPTRARVCNEPLSKCNCTSCCVYSLTRVDLDSHKRSEG